MGKEGNLLSLDGFIQRYFYYLKKAKTNEEAYHLTAKEYKELYGMDRYSCYDSFRRVKNRKLKSN